MRNTVVAIAVIVIVIGGLLRLYFSRWVLFIFTVGPKAVTVLSFFTLGPKEAVTVGLIGDIIGLIGIILLIYGLTYNLKYS